jgi:hypothetical protein
MNTCSLAVISDDPTLCNLLLDLVSAEGIRVSVYSYAAWGTSVRSTPQWSQIFIDPQRRLAETD